MFGKRQQACCHAELGRSEAQTNRNDIENFYIVVVFDEVLSREAEKVLPIICRRLYEGQNE